MYDRVGVGSKDWRKEIVWRFKMGAPCVPVRRGLVPVSGSFKQILLSSYRRVLAFLPGSGSQVECDVTHSKQTSAPFLRGSRIATTHSMRRGTSSPFFARSIQSALRNPRTSLQILPRLSAEIFFTINA
jgi:hypothetical protein